MTYYKLVYKKDNTLLSPALLRWLAADNIKHIYGYPDAINSLIIEYKMDEFVRPNNLDSRLFVFTTLYYAQDYLNDFPQDMQENLEIYECEVKNPCERSRYLGSIGAVLDRFVNHNKTIMFQTNPLYGVVYCTHVKLVKKVQ